MQRGRHIQSGACASNVKCLPLLLVQLLTRMSSYEIYIDVSYVHIE